MKTTVSLFVIFIFVAFAANAQDEKFVMPLLGEKAPAFSAQSTQGKINFPKDYKNSWKVILSHPKDFTPVCSSELLELAYMQNDFANLNTKILVISTDLLTLHESWVKSLEELSEKQGKPVKINFPLVDDNSMDVSRKFGMLHKATSTSRNVRAVFVIDPSNVVRSIQYYPNEVGRNMKELKRTVQALQTTVAHTDVHTPANWEPGDYVLIPYLTDEDKKKIEASDSEIRQEAWYLNYKKLKE